MRQLSSTTQPVLAVSNLETAASLPLVITEDGTIRLPVQARQELYQFSAVLDGAEFDWDELYEVLGPHFKSAGELTGPWDFSLAKHNAPLVPAFRVSLDGEPLGIWYMQRISLEDLEVRRFRGRMAFFLPDDAPHELVLTPFREVNVRWLSAVLEPDPEDMLAPVDYNLTDWPARCPAGCFADPAWWAEMKSKLDTTHALFRVPMDRFFTWLRARRDSIVKDDTVSQMRDYLRAPLHPEDILPYLALYHLEGDTQALELAIGAVERAVELPHWGNPDPDGYGHDGDMGAAFYLRALAWAWHSLGPHLAPAQRERLREKLALQGRRFFNLSLLHRDYWGGSVIQDHGWRSLFAFGAAALHLLGVVPEAARWVSFIIPRLRRSLDAMPRDGAIPPSSYSSPILYLDETTHYRDALLALTGEDIFDQGPFAQVVDYLVEMTAGETAPPPSGGNHCLNRLAQKYGDGRAARLQRLLIGGEAPVFHHGAAEHGYFHGVLWGFLTYAPVVEVERLPAPRPLAFYEDSGFVLYRQAGATLSLRCGPWSGYTAYRKAPGPCDRMDMFAGGGHFTLAVDGAPLLVTPDGGYKLMSSTRNVLLINGKGPVGDIGYPMSIPGFRARGDEILFARWDEEAQTGWVRLDLGPAYPHEMGVAVYTRDFILKPDRIICRDRVVFSRPHTLTWLFHTHRDTGVVHEGGLACRIGTSPCLHIEAVPVGGALTAATGDTQVVYSYSSDGFRKFVHARYDTPEAVSAMAVDFVITPGM